MQKASQISALVSDTTRELLERHTRQTGVNKGHLIEQALLHHLQALEAVPAEYVIHPRLVVSRRTGEKELHRMESAEPPDALRRLMSDGDQGTSREP